MAYTFTWIGMQRVDAIDLASGGCAGHCRGNREFLDMIGPVGVLASDR